MTNDFYQKITRILTIFLKQSIQFGLIFGLIFGLLCSPVLMANGNDTSNNSLPKTAKDIVAPGSGNDTSNNSLPKTAKDIVAPGSGKKK